MNSSGKSKAPEKEEINKFNQHLSAIANPSTLMDTNAFIEFLNQKDRQHELNEMGILLDSYDQRETTHTIEFDLRKDEQIRGHQI